MRFRPQKIKSLRAKKRVKVYPKEEKKEWDFSKATRGCKKCYGRGYTGLINREIKGVGVTEKIPCKCVIKWHRENDEKEKLENKK